MRPFLASLPIVLLLACSSSSAPSPLAHNTAAVLEGTTDDGDRGVVAVLLSAGADSELCSGYAITADLILTARHCVSPVVDPTGGCTSTEAGPPSTNGEPHTASSFFVFQDTTIVETSTGLKVAEVIIPPDTTGQPTCGNDLALLRLTAPLDEAVVVAPRLDTPPTVGETISIVGYGASAGGTDTTSGTRRSRAGLLVKQIGASSRTVDGEWIIDKGSCAGDSGSPAIDASGLAIGVMSRGSKTTCTSMIYQRLDSHADWLRAQGLASAARLGIDPPTWAGGPSDAGATDANDAEPIVDSALDSATEIDSGSPLAPSGGDGGGCTTANTTPSGASSALWAASVIGLLVAARRRKNARRAPVSACRPAR